MNKPLSLGALLRLKLQSDIFDEKAFALTVARCSPNSVRARRGDDKSNCLNWEQRRFILTCKDLHDFLVEDEMEYINAPRFLRIKSPLPDGLRVYSHRGYVIFTHNVGADNDRMDRLMEGIGFRAETVFLKDLRDDRRSILDMKAITSYQGVARFVSRSSTTMRGCAQREHERLQQEIEDGVNTNGYH